MDIPTMSELLSTFGFPIVCVIALGWFVLYLIKADKEENMKAIERMESREDKLLKEIQESREVNKEALKVLAEYASKLTTIENNVSDIKQDVEKLSKAAF